MQPLREPVFEERAQTVRVARAAPSARQTEPRSTRDKIEKIRANNPIEQVIGRYVELRPSGRRLVGCCPFHEDRSPSLVVYPSNGSWYCFACDVGGDVFTFIQQIENVSFGVALHRLEPAASNSRSPLRTPASTGASSVSQVFLGQSEPSGLTEEHFTLLTAATEVYHAAIFSQPAILQYLVKRKIDLDMIRRHRIGYASGDNLAKYFRFRGWDPEVASDVGLVGPRGECFRQRIVIPELRGGKTIYLVGRATQKYQKAKYVGLSGVPKPLYGAESIRGASEVFVCEGVADWLTLVDWGYAAVALLGSHLKPDQASELANAERIFIATDSDEPGRKAAQQLAETFGERARIVPPLRNAKDINELATRRRGREIFSDLVQQARVGSRVVSAEERELEKS